MLRLSLPIRPARLAPAVTIADQPPHLFTYVDVRKRLLQTLYITRGQHYVPRYLCSPVPMFPDPMFPGTDVPRYLCSPVPMFPGTYVPRYRCSPNLCSPVPTVCSPVPMFPEHMFPGTDVPRFTANFIGVNITAFGRKLTLFSAIPLSRFSLKMSRFFACFELEKMHSTRSAQTTRRGRQPASNAGQR